MGISGKENYICKRRGRRFTASDRVLVGHSITDVMDAGQQRLQAGEKTREKQKTKTQPAKGWLLSCPSVSLFVPVKTKIMDGGSDVLFFSLLSVIVAELYN